MSAAAISHYASNVVRYDPQAAQQARDAAANAQQQRQQQLRALPEQALEGELLNKQRKEQSRQTANLSEDEFLSRHQEQRTRSNEGFRSTTQRALAAYQTTAEITHPADVDRIGYVDIYV